MWGFYNARARPLAQSIFDKFTDRKIATRFYAGLKSPKGNDQNFLSQYVFGSLSSNSITHDSYLCTSYGGNSLPFPTQRIGDCYVGGVAGCSKNATFRECPVRCRPKDHQDWNYC